MAINIKVTLRPVPGTHNEEHKWYGSVNSNGCTSLDSLTERISAMCSVSPSDVKGVLAGLQEQAINAMRNGDGLSLGELGTIYVHCSSRLTANANDCDLDKLRGIYPMFMASARLRKAVAKKHLQLRIL